MLEYPWFAVQARPNREKLVASLLSRKGFTVFLPLYSTRRRWSDRYKNIQSALFPGYVFCRFDPWRRMPILTTAFVHSIVGFGDSLAEVDETEIQAVQAIVNSGLGVEPWPYLRAGERVRINSGPLFGVEGIFLETKNRSRVVVSVTLLQRSVAVEIDRSWVLPVSIRAPALEEDLAGVP